MSKTVCLGIDSKHVYRHGGGGGGGGGKISVSVMTTTSPDVSLKQRRCMEAEKRRQNTSWNVLPLMLQRLRSSGSVWRGGFLRPAPALSQLDQLLPNCFYRHWCKLTDSLGRPKLFLHIKLSLEHYIRLAIMRQRFDLFSGVGLQQLKPY